MMSYPLFKVHVATEEALELVRQVFDSGFINEGTQVTQLTQEMQRILVADNLILMNSCTSAISLALRLAGVTSFDSVVSTPMTCVATNTPIVAARAKIKWADIDPQHGMVTARTVEDAIDLNTRAVIVVAWAGNPPDLSGIRRVCDEHGVAFILDAAHAFGATYQEQPIHEWADFTCYSFQAIKHFTTGDGGALVVRDPYNFKRSKALKWFGLDRDHAKDDKGNWKGQQWDVDILEAGFKYNMNNVAAAIGLSQVPHIDKILESHRTHAAAYDLLFSGSETVHPNVRLSAGSSHWVYDMQVDPDRSKLNRDELLKALNAEGIMAGVVHVPNDDYTCFEQFRTELPGVRKFSANQFNLPCGWWLQSADIHHIAKRVVELTT